MRKYANLWHYIKNCGQGEIVLSFSEIRSIAGAPIDHSFLRYKKELVEYGWEVGKISMKEQKVLFKKKEE